LNIELINTGSELLTGRVLNTHQQWLCRQLADRGYLVARQVAVPDTAPAVQQAVREALGRAALVITTGGLGPTSDDLTRDAIAALFGRQLVEDPAVVAHLEAWFAARRRPRPASTQVQALVPEGALVLPNANGTAPGLILEGPSPQQASRAERVWLVMLPGPPRELRPMFLEQVLPWLRQNSRLPAPFLCRTLRSSGLGESLVQERIAGPLAELVQAGLEIGYCARPGEVDIRLSARGEAVRPLLEEAEATVRRLIGQHVYGDEDDVGEAVVVRLLTDRRQTLVLAESCTGGRIASRITDVPGASAVFLGGLVTYSNELKQQCLGVHPQTLAEHGAASEPVAREMAEGARARYRADYALAVTGIAGPSGGSEVKPVGTVFLALATPDRTTVVLQVNTFDRETFKHVTSQQGLELLRRALLG